MKPKEIDVTIAVDANTPMRADTQASFDFQGLTGVAVVTLHRRLGGRTAAHEASLWAASHADGKRGGRPDDERSGPALFRAHRHKVLAENSGDLRTMVSNLTSFSEALGKNSGRVDNDARPALRAGTTGGGRLPGSFMLSARCRLPPSLRSRLRSSWPSQKPEALLSTDEL